MKTQHPKAFLMTLQKRYFSWQIPSVSSNVSLGPAHRESRGQGWARLGRASPGKPDCTIFCPELCLSLASSSGGARPPMNLGGPVPISLLICFSKTRLCFLPTQLNYHLVKKITLRRPTAAGGKQPAERRMKKMILTIWRRQWNRGGRASGSH